jgi:hypothetical protein
MNEEATQVIPPERQPLFRRKQRPMEDLLRDNALLFQIGRVVGAAQLAAVTMSQSGDENLKMQGAKLDEMVQWFFEDAK